MNSSLCRSGLINHIQLTYTLTNMKKLILKKPLSSKLGRLPDKVKQLHYRGMDPNEILSAPTVAVVGTRKPTPYGKQITEQIVTELVRVGVVIVSGLAFGIDTIAHKTALAENGRTIAVLSSGLDKIYPTSHENTARKILRDGSLISETHLNMSLLAMIS